MKEDTCQAHGGPRSECPDDEADWFPQMHVCQVEMQLEGAKRLFELKHKEQPYHDGTRTFWSDKPSRAHPFHFNDGVRIWMSPVELDPDNDFLD